MEEDISPICISTWQGIYPSSVGWRKGSRKQVPVVLSSPVAFMTGLPAQETVTPLCGSQSFLAPIFAFRPTPYISSIKSIQQEIRDQGGHGVKSLTGPRLQAKNSFSHLLYLHFSPHSHRLHRSAPLERHCITLARCCCMSSGTDSPLRYISAIKLTNIMSSFTAGMQLSTKIDKRHTTYELRRTECPCLDE